MDVSLTISNHVDNLVSLNKMLRHQGKKWGLSERSQGHLELVAEELFVNVVSHGYNPGQSGQIQVALEQQGPRLRLTMQDDARPFDPTQDQSLPHDLDLDSRPVGGLGLFLVRRLSESIIYYRTADNKNRVVVYLSL